MRTLLHNFERYIVLLLLGLMMLTIFVSTIELAVVIYQQLLQPPLFLLHLDNMIEIFGFFLMVLIGLELLETINTHLHEDRVHAEVVFLVAIVAIARKVIILDYRTTSASMLVGMAAMILALGLGYYLVRRAMVLHAAPPAQPPQ